MPIQDSSLVLRATSDGAFVSSVPEHYHYEINGTPLDGMAVHLKISATHSEEPILFCKVHASSTSAAATTDSVIAERTGMTEGAEYIIPFSTSKRAICVLLDTSSTTTSSFSIIQADITLGFGQDWRRSVEFY